MLYHIILYHSDLVPQRRLRLRPEQALAEDGDSEEGLITMIVIIIIMISMMIILIVLIVVNTLYY